MKPGLPQDLTALVDAHAHYHDCFDLIIFLDGALANFQRAAQPLGLTKSCVGCLLIADMAHQNSFQRFVESANRRRLGHWDLRNTDEQWSLLGYRDDHLKLILVTGRQIVCAEGIELLALGSDQEIPDGLPLPESLRAICQSKAIPVFPWGFGKWWFRRGAIVAELLRGDHTAQRPAIFLGDNSGRPRHFREPRLFDMAKAHAVRVLSGSDPLPLLAHNGNAGRYGFAVHGKISLDQPGRHIKELIETNLDQPITFGQLETFANFCRDQLLTQLRKLARWRPKPTPIRSVYDPNASAKG